VVLGVEVALQFLVMVVAPILNGRPRGKNADKERWDRDENHEEDIVYALSRAGWPMRPSRSTVISHQHDMTVRVDRETSARSRGFDARWTMIRCQNKTSTVHVELSVGAGKS
jgi:hypothetical protein